MSLFEQKISPMLAMSIEKPFDSLSHLFEIKWDGTRAICFAGEKQRLQNRRLHDITKRYPEIKVEIKKGKAILDGEIIVVHRGKPDFKMLQLREQLDDTFKIASAAKEYPAEYLVFDVIYSDGADLTGKPLLKRKQILKDILSENEQVTVCDFVMEKGIEYYGAATERGLEGIIAKQIDSPYLPGGRSNFWLKIKKIKTLDCIICGITAGNGARAEYFGALILGAYAGGELQYMGKVGSGFDEEQLKFLDRLLSPLKGICPFKAVPDVGSEIKSWLEPEAVCEVRYLELTQDRKLRAPVFIRLRNDKAPEDCKIEL